MEHLPEAAMRRLLLLALALAAPSLQAAQYSALPDETPAHFVAPAQGMNFEKRDVMIPMRDGAKLHTVILVPKGARRAAMLLTRTPYSASAMASRAVSGSLEMVLAGYDNAADIIVQDGYIRVLQDIRGKYASEGDFVMARPLRGPQNPTPVDESTDTYDTIDWLVKNVPESNGKVGTLGISYDGFEPLMALVNPHPALKVSVPMNPMVDGWRGDDWFHNGAFRQTMLAYILDHQSVRGEGEGWFTNDFDDYTSYLSGGSAGDIARAHGMDQLGFWRKIVAHPAYDSFWQDQALDKILAGQPLKVPTMLVHSLWDQEDIYGAMAVYKAIKPKDTGNDKVFLVVGPWHHGQEIGEASSLGAVKFGSDTGLAFRQDVLRPFLARYLKDDAPKTEIAPVTAFQTGTNRWQKLRRWPGCEGSCERALYFDGGSSLSFAEPKEKGGDEYVSDPAKPVPFVPRPVHSSGDPWRHWLTTDQRMFSDRTDVLTFTTGVLDAPVAIAGSPMAHLVASTSGTDSDWVVKLIDVYPGQVAAQPEMGGFQLMVAGDIFRGRYRQGLDKPAPIPANTPQEYSFALPTTNHVFLPGHRIMVQVQSSWFPLYDRNPQTYVDNIFNAKPSDYRRATQTVWHGPGAASRIDLPVVAAGAKAGN
jgi:uncharacterized protein